MMIRGIQTGDGECWCFLVTRHTYRKVTGKNPSVWDRHHRGVRRGSPYRYRLYPGHLIGWDWKDRVVDLEIIVFAAPRVKKAGKTP